MEAKLRQTRRHRGLLVVVAAVAVALGATPAAQSTQGQPVIAGQFNDSTSTTVFENTAAGGTSLRANGGFTGIGLYGQSGNGIGVRALNQSAGSPALLADNFSTDGGVAIEAMNRAPNWVAIWGHHDAATIGYGVLGEAPIGVGVVGRGSLAGVEGSTDAAAAVGVLAKNTAGGTALETLGAVKFSTAGIATVPAGQGQVTVAAGVDVTTNTKVLVTQMSGGKKFTFVERNFAADTLTFRLQRAATNNVTLAYFVIS